jgi:putative transposase
MCQTLEISIGAYFAWRERPESNHRQEDRRLTDQITVAHQGSRGTYGAPRIKAELAGAGRDGEPKAHHPPDDWSRT